MNINDHEFVLNQHQEDSNSSNSSSTSSSGGTGSSSSSSSSENNYNSRNLEAVKLQNEIFHLPKDLCANAEIFNEFLSIETWNSLSGSVQNHLLNFLPKFKENVDEENNITLQQLLTGQIDRFNETPLRKVQQNLEEGNYRPNIVKINKSIKKAQRREERFQKCERISRMAKSMVCSREKLLRMAYASPPNSKLYTSRYPPYIKKNLKSFPNSGVGTKAKKLYLEEIASLKAEIGLYDILSDEDEEDLKVAQNVVVKQKKRAAQENSLKNETSILSTLSYKNGPPNSNDNSCLLMTENYYKQLLSQHKRRKILEPDHPDLSSCDIKIKDVISRTQLSSEHRKQYSSSKQSSEDSMKLKGKLRQELQQSLNKSNPQMLHRTLSTSFVDGQKSTIQKQMNRSQSLLLIGQNDSVFETKPNLSSHSDSDDEEDLMKSFTKESQSSFLTPTSNSPVNTSRKRPTTTTTSSISPKRMIMHTNATLSSTNNNDEDIKLLHQTHQNMTANKIITKTLPLSDVNKNLAVPVQFGKPAGTFSELVGIDMLHMPSVVEYDDNDILNHIPKQSDKQVLELMQETHACFLSLIRDIFCSTPDHRMAQDELKYKVSNWMRNPITPLNDWYYEADGDWLSLLESAVHFLSGEFLDQPDDFVPYLEYKHQLNIYQWIGASRDSDNRLIPLCQYWLSRKNDMGVSKSDMKHMKGDGKYSRSHSLNNSINDDDDYAPTEKSLSPPPPRFPTDWTVRPATDEEIRSFRSQEKRRYENPHMAFTYHQHYYDSVVGPVKGIYTQVPGISKARGHTMLVADRPNFVTILTLVRDATARLPNGEGTRADICELLKSSQYISPTASDQVLQTIVSGALDRMHTEYDPCVKYDPKRKIWIYLHRNRTVEEFERLHQQYQGVAKHKKTILRKSKSKSSCTPPKTSQKSSTETSPKKTSPIAVLNAAVTQVPTATAVAVNTLIKHQMPLPALSNIQNVKKISSSPPPLTTKLSYPSGSVPQKVIKPELVPIKKEKLSLEHIDVEATLDAHTTPIIVKNANASQNMPGLLVENTNRIQKIVGKNIISNVISINNPQKGSNLVKINMSSGETLSSPSSASTSTANKSITSAIVNQQGQSILLNQSGSPQSVLTKKLINTTKSIVINQNQAPPLISTGKMGGQNFIITSLTKQIRGTAPPALTNTIVPGNKMNSLLQNKNIVRLPHQPINKNIVNQGTIGVQPIRAQTLLQKMSPSNGDSQISQQQNIVQVKTPLTVVTTNSPNIAQKSNFVNTITIPKGQQTVLTTVQQKQLLQNIFAQQKQKGTNSVFITQHIQQNTGTVVHQTNQQKIPALALSTSTGNAVFSTQSGVAAGTSLINPQMIQIKSTNIPNSSNKIQTVVSSQQIPLIRTQTPNKPSMVKTSQPIETTLIKSPIVHVSSPNIIASSPSTITRLVKPGTSIALQQSPKIIRTTNTIGSGGPIMAKIMTNTGSQLISLDSLLQKQGLAPGTTLRVTGAKPNQTQLIQLPGTGGSQITQYAVVSSQPRSIVTVSQPQRTITTQAGSGSSMIKTTDVTTTQSIQAATSNIIVNQNAHLHQDQQIKLIQTNSQNVQGTQLVNAKIVGVQNFGGMKGKTGTTGIRMVNASNLNIAHIGGKPVIIASKTPNLKSATTQANVPQQQNIIIQSNSNTGNSANIVIGGQTLKVHSNILAQGSGNLINHSPNTSQAQTIMLSNQLVKLQNQANLSQINTSSSLESGMHLENSDKNPNTIVIAGGSAKQTIKMQSPNMTNIKTGQQIVLGTQMKNTQKITSINPQSQRVVLATPSGQFVPQQIIIPSNYQTGNFNLKRLKIIPISQAKGNNDRPMYTQIITSLPQTSKATVVKTEESSEMKKINSDNVSTD